MTLTNLHKTPWPWFGGKADAADLVWQALGDPAHYVEPFAGSLAVLLRRPHEANRVYHSETVNDLDGLLVNAWRSIQMSPHATAEAASWPVAEADLMARHLAILKWKQEREVEHLMGDPLFHDPVIAGWWIWGQSSWIGSGWCSGQGPWIVGADGRITRREKGEQGVWQQRPHLGNNGQGVNHAGTREPGVSRQLPHLGDDGKGVNRPGTREAGVSRQLPHLGDNGKGVNHAGTREPGVGEYHPMTMPETLRWFDFLSARLRHVRILNGDWTRAVTNGASLTIGPRMGKGHAAIFLDPPYADASERSETYACEDFDVAHAVREWALGKTDDKRVRIVVAGYDGDHTADFERAGWIALPWFKAGFLKGGMSNTGGSDKHQQARERLFISPSCGYSAEPASGSQSLLFGGEE
jgi:site-specific DNA-adenine methylase